MKKIYSKGIRKQIFHVVILLLSLIFAESNLSAQNPLSSAQDFNIITEGNLTIKAGDIEGAIAVGGNLVIQGNSQRTSANATGGQAYVNINGLKYALVVGGGLTGVNGGNVFKVDGKSGLTDDHFIRFYSLSGSTAAAGSGGIDIGNPVTTVLNRYVRVNSTTQTSSSVENTTSLVNFSAAFTDFRTQATSMSACTGNVTPTVSGGQATLNLGANTTNVWNVAGSTLNSYSQINLTGNLPSAARPLVINVNASGTFSWNNLKLVMGSESDNYMEINRAPYIIWNFYNTTTLTITTSNLILGSVFAPNAAITNNGSGNITGQIVAKSFTKPYAGELHIAKFNANVACAATSCTCAGNLVANPSFENGTTSWDWSGGTLSAGGGAVACGSYSGDFQISNTSSNWVSQTIGTDLPVGTVINASVYAGTHDNSYYHEVGVYFFDANWNWLSGASVEVNKVLANSPAGPQLYTWTAIVPVGTKYTQVGYSGNGDWIKTDQWCVTLAAGTTVAFGNQLFIDLNGNGVKDGSDWGYDGVTVKLYADANEDGVADGAALKTTTTSGGGYYNFANLAAGKYLAQIENAPYWMYVIPKNGGDPDNDIDDDNNGLTQSGSTIKGGTITLSVGDEPGSTSYNSTYDFAVYKDNGLGDYVFLDADADGIQDAGEGGIAGVTVRLKNTSGTVLATTTTDANGYYYFYDPSQYGTTTYSIQFVTPSGYFPSPSNQGSDDSKDSDPVGGVISNVTVPIGTWNNSFDAGYYQATANLGNYVWHDQNNNGVQDAGEPVISGATVKLYADANGDNTPDGAAVATTTTNTSGVYAFANLAPGKYIVGVTIPSGFAAGATTATSAAPDNDNNTDNNGVNTISGELRSNYITLSIGGEPTTDGDGNNGNLTLDFGLKGTGSIGDFVWNDLNGNGIQDAGEPGISGATVTLTYPNGATATTTTDANGAYSFANLASGTYSVSFTTPSGYTASPANQGTDDTKDSDPVSGVVSGIVLTAGQNNTTIDAGFQSNQLNLGDKVWYDQNNNGVQDANETGINGATVNLYKDTNGDNVPDGASVATTTTNASGVYSFSGLTPGNYIVGVVIPAGYTAAAVTATSSLPNNDNNTDNNGVTTVGSELRSNFITLTTGGEPASGVDGDGTNGNLTLDFGLKGTGSIGDYVWLDANANGIQEAGEPGISGVTVTLTYPNGTTTATTTDANGAYGFTNLAPGTYSVSFSAPIQYALSPANQGTDDTKDSDPVSGVVSGIVLTAGQNNTTIDAGYFTAVNLGNYVWNDQNNNGVQDAGEPVISGSTVYLYKDANGDNIPDGAAVATTTTNASGIYSFSELVPGNYIVGVVLPVGYSAGATTATSASPDNDNNTDNNGITTVSGEVRSNYITLTCAGEPTTDGDGNNGNLTLDFGLKGTGSIGDFVWNDLNGNGIQDAGEPGISGATVTLTYPNGATATTTTDANGAYSFANLAPGTYSVSFTTPSGYTSSPANQGTDDTKDSDPVSGVVSGITLTAGQSNLTIDAGFQSNQLNLGNYVWYDRNNNGVQDAGEAGISGVSVKLYKDADGNNIPDGAAVATTTTVAGGLYSFSGLTPGNYIAGITAPAGYAMAFTTASSLLPNNDNNTDNNGITIIGSEITSNFITLTTGGEPAAGIDGDGTNGNLTLDFGLKGTGSLGDFVWHDLNGNGIQDAGEPGISGATVTLTYPGGATTSATTDATGAYSFTNLAPGSYSVTFSSPAGYTPATSNAGTDDTKDSDPVSGVVSGITLTAGQNNTTIDAGFYQPLNLGNYVWYDRNNNGTQDAGEPVVNGATVNLYADANGDNTPDGAAIATTTTNAGGVYSFSSLAPGNYITGVVIPAGYTATVTTATSASPNNDNNADNNGVTTVSGELRSNYITLVSGAEPTADGDGNNGNLTLDFGLKGTASIGDFVWNDLNGNGVQDAGEPGISGATVTLTYPDGTTLNVTTGANGAYSFTNLAPGTYSVSFTTPSGYTASPANQGTDDTKDSDPVSGVVTGIVLTAGQNNITIDAGFQSTQLNLGNYVWYDQNNNGVQDATEPVISGATVNLYKDANGDNVPDGTSIANTTTNAGGLYNFSGLTPGNYIAGVVIPAGYTAGGVTATSASPNNDNNTDNNGVNTVSGELRSNFITLTTGGEPSADGDGTNGNLTLDFGLKGTASLGDFVWNDLNGNGIQEAGEPGISSATVTLTYPNGSTAITTTDVNGAYSFVNLIPGTYSVSFTTPSGYIASPANQGTDDTKDSDPVSGLVSGIVLTAGQNNTTIDAGFQSNQLNLGNYVWYDKNNNGIQDAGEAGISGVSVKLYTDADANNIPDGAPVATTTTNASGVYSFGGLTPGNYIVGITAPAGYAMAFTTASSLLPNNDNNTDNNGITIIGTEVTSNFITLTALGEPTTDGDGSNGNLSLDFGLKGTGSIGDFVWNDFDGDGIQDAGEPGIGGASVTLTYPDGTTISTTTDANGGYSFTNLAPGTYSVSFITPSGFVSSPANQGGDDSKDSDPVAGVVSGINLSAGQTNLTIDAGFQSNQLVLGNYVWYDKNNNGVQDAGEAPIANATVRLYADANGDNAPDGAAVANTSTNANGEYSFTGLTPGNYIVGVVPPAGYTASATTGTSAAPDNDNNTDNNGVAIVSGEIRSNHITLTTLGEPTTDGDGSNGNLTLDFGLTGNGSLGNFVWQDLNNNGVQDAGEPGIAGVVVTLTNPDGSTISTTTDANGAYQFTNLLPGTYSVGFTTPSGYLPATANAGSDDAIDSDPVGGAVTGIVLTAGESNQTIDAGFRKLINLSGNVWHDVNGMTDNLVNNSGAAQTPPAAPVPANLIAYLVNLSTGLVEKITFVNPADGKFSFTNVTPNTNYYVLISTTFGVLNVPPPASTLPSGWLHTGQQLGSPAVIGHDGLNDGRLIVPIGATDVINVNFGIRKSGGDVVIG